jgi:pimeloyl-ACP methyl ester carboxylesterase
VRKLGMSLLWTLVVLLALAAALYLLLRRGDVPYAALEKKYATPASRYADLPGGIRMHYEDVGDPHKPAIMLLHGYGDSFLTWQPVVERLKDRFHLIVPDLPGHGLTRAPGGFVAEQGAYARVVDVFAGEIGLKRFAIVGNSMGGGVAWRYALDHPDKVSGLVLVDAAGWPDETLKAPPLAFRILMSRPGRWYLQRMETVPITRAALQADFHNPALATDAFVRRWVEVQRAPGHRRILMSLRPSAASAASREKLSKIAVPTLILWGRDDHLIAPASAEKFKQAIAGSELVYYPNAGHLPQWEQPDRTATDIGSFVQRRASK